MANEIKLVIAVIAACIGGLAMFEFIRWRISKPARKCRCNGVAKAFKEPAAPLEIPAITATIEPQYDIHKQNWILVKRLPGTIERQRVGNEVYESVLDAMEAAELRFKDSKI